MAVSRYTIKRAVLAPYTAMKRRSSRDLDHTARSILETQYYRPAIYAFMRATTANPDLLLEADLDAGSVVLDIGAYIGEWSEQISERYGSQIYAFDANPNAVRRFRDRLRQHENVRLFAFGLGAHDEQVTLALEGPGSNAYASNGTFGTLTAELRDVVAVLEELGIEHVDLCKINIEGGEYDLFDRLIEADWIPRLDLISVQFHEWLPRAYARRRSIRRTLARTHDECWNYPFVWELWRRRDDVPAVSPTK
jgi:FkbM family methyltransferase